MNRHVALVGALAALALLLPATAAQARVDVTVTAPSNGQIITSASASSIGVRTTYEVAECPDSVRVGLFDTEGAQVHEDEVSLDVVRVGAYRCDIRGGSRDWGGRSLDPVTLEPFLEDHRACNGGYELRATARRQGENPRTGTARFAIQLSGSAPSDVSVRGGVERATIEWSPAPEPDVTGYRILRGDLGDPDWEIVVGPDVTTVEDADAPAGRHEYRVATLRADGRIDGHPAEPCTDDGKDLQTTSAAVPATVDPPATESESGSESETSTETESESATETTSPEATRTPTPTPEDEPEPGPQSEPHPVDTTEQTPEPTEVETTESQYDEQLDFSGVGPSPSEEESDGGAVALDVPGGSSEMDQLLGPILRPIAGGMILLVFALHLRRWSRDVW